MSNTMIAFFFSDDTTFRRVLSKEQHMQLNDALDCFVLYTIVALTKFGPIHLTEGPVAGLCFPLHQHKLRPRNPITMWMEPKPDPLDAVMTIADMDIMMHENSSTERRNHNAPLKAIR
jgi:hypothetical protein